MGWHKITSRDRQQNGSRDLGARQPTEPPWSANPVPRVLSLKVRAVTVAQRTICSNFRGRKSPPMLSLEAVRRETQSAETNGLGATMSKKSNKWVQLQGRWQFDHGYPTYAGPDEKTGRAEFGLCLSSTPLRSGVVRTKLKLSTTGSAGRIVLGYNAATGGYYSVGLGGHDSAYVLVLFTPGRGWQPLDVRGAASQLSTDHTYDAEVHIIGQRVTLTIDGVRVLDNAIPAPLQGDQIGLFAWGAGVVAFEDFQVSADQLVFCCYGKRPLTTAAVFA